MDTPAVLPFELRRHHIFAGLDESQLHKVIQSAQIIRLEEDQHLFNAGEDAKHFYLVRNGSIKLYLSSAEGSEKVLHLVKAGETFAEAIMFMDSPIYPVNASALINTEVISFSNKVFREILRDSVDTCFRLMADMSTWLKKQVNEIDALTMLNASLRFTHYLLQQIPPDQHQSISIELEAPKNVIASRLSIQPESLSRILRNLQNQGLIETTGSLIEIRDIDKLRATCISIP
mgnify:CR=1 FL=1